MNKKIKKMNAVMMEYVLIAVLIAAAVVGAVMFFGRQVSGGLATAGAAMTSQSAAEKQRSDAIATIQNETSTAAGMANSFHKKGSTAVNNNL